MTEQVHGRASRLASNADPAYRQLVSVLIEALIERADARGQVICFASAAELGLVLRHLGERCRQAAVQTGSDSIMVLFWAALRRMDRKRNGSSNELKLERLSLDSSSAETAAGADGWLRVGPCRLCEYLHADPRCASGHEGLIAKSGKYIFSVGERLLSEAQVFQCVRCRAIWKRYKHRSELFVVWSIKMSLSTEWRV